MKFAPIVLFVYNRPWHTRQTIEALKKNYLAEESILYIYSDGPKTENDKIKVKEVRDYIKNIKGFKEIKIIEREKNIGLADSIITGVTEIINKHGIVIALEDDLITSPSFLKFMNDALEFYSEDKKIFTISGYCYPIKIPKDYNKDMFIDYRSSSWGWATWKDRWEKIDWDVKDYHQFLKNKKAMKEFNRSGELTEMLISQQKGKIDSWAIRRTYAQFKNNSFTLFPVWNLVRNIGFDRTGVHCGKNNKKINTELLTNIYDFQMASNLYIDSRINKRIKKISSENRLKKKIKKILVYFKNLKKRTC